MSDIEALTARVEALETLVRALQEQQAETRNLVLIQSLRATQEKHSQALAELREGQTTIISLLARVVERRMP